MFLAGQQGVWEKHYWSALLAYSTKYCINLIAVNETSIIGQLLNKHARAGFAHTAHLGSLYKEIQCDKSRYRINKFLCFMLTCTHLFLSCLNHFFRSGGFRSSQAPSSPRPCAGALIRMRSMRWKRSCPSRGMTCWWWGTPGRRACGRERCSTSESLHPVCPSTLFHSDLHQERAFFLSCFETTLQKMVAFCAVVNPFGHVASCLVRWFLRKYPGMAGCSPADKEHFEYPIGEADLFNILPLTLSSYRL